MIKVFISSQTPNSISSMLRGIGLDLVYLPPEPSLPLPVACHADMLIFENIVQRNYFEQNKALFDDCDMILTDEQFGKEYPKDVLLNAFAVRDMLFGRLESLCAKVKELYPKHINLRQGYAKCSTLLFGNNAITADIGIAKTLSEKGINTLLITPGHICLPGYDYGFIGGASFVYENKVIFFGNIEPHPEYTEIREFISTSGYEMIYDPSSDLTDIGGAVIIPLKQLNN